MKNQTIHTWCPLFPGFYNTILEYDYDLHFEGGYDEFEKLPFNEQRKLLRNYEKSVAKNWCELTEDTLNSIGIKCKIKFEALYSPSYYNFENDSINISVTLDVHKLGIYFAKHKDELEAYFIDNFTSRDGFASYYSPDIDVWIDKYFGQMKEKGTVLGSVLEAILDANGVSADSMSLDMYEFCCV